MGITKICSKCQIEKELVLFPISKIHKGGKHTTCKSCRYEEYKISSKKIERVKKKKEYEKNYRKAHYLKKQYNITLEEYKNLLVKQNNCCKICSNHESNFKNQLAVDHCHKTKEIRGLLCYNCNRAIGLLKDDVQILQNAIKYLKGS